MHIQFIDRQVYSLIRNHITLRSKQGLEVIRSVDTEGQTISSLLALFNHKLQQGLRTSDMLDRLPTEAKLIDKIYKKAATDTDFLNLHKLTLVNTFSNGSEHKLQEAMLFIHLLQHRLEDAQKIENPKTVCDEIFALSTKLRIEGGNPLIIAALAALYGHKVAQELFKKEELNVNKGNVLTDVQLRLINLYLLPDLVSHYSKQVWDATKNQHPSTIGYSILTAAPQLNDFISSLEVAGIPVEKAIAEKAADKKPAEPSYECEYSMSLTLDLFPKLTEDEKQLNHVVGLITRPLPAASEKETAQN